MVIRKGDMKERAAKAAAAAPNIDDRLQHARDMAAEHPAETTQPRTSPSEPPGFASTVIFGDGVETPPISGNQKSTHKIVPLELIDQNPFNARRVYRMARIHEIAASIGAHGQETPGTATMREGRYILAAGHYRLRALKHLGAKMMELMIREDLTDKQLYEVSYRENAEREDQSSLDNAIAWRGLLDDGVYGSEVEIAEATGQSKANVNKTLAALRLSTDVREVINDDPGAFKLSVLYELALYEPVGGVEQTKALAKLVAEGMIGRKEIQEARAKEESPTQRKRKETSRQYKMLLGGEAIGSLKEWDSGKVSFEVQLTDPTSRAALVEELKARFGI